MRRTKKLFLISVVLSCIVMALLLTAALSTNLLANREMVKSFIVTKTAQATGGTLVYDRLDISFLPMPHLKARDIHLRRPGAFEVYADELSVYPRILPILKGQISIRRLALASPDIEVFVGSDSMKAPAAPTGRGVRSLEDSIRTAIGGLFGALATIDPGTDLRIEEGTVTLVFTDSPDLRTTGINAAVENDDGDLSLNLNCQSDAIGKLTVSAKADIEAIHVGGQIRLTGANVRPLLLYASLPDGITTEDTRATVNATFTVDGPETVHSRFDFKFPALTVMRNDLKLDLHTAAISGTVDYADKSLSLSIDTLQSAQPALDVSAAAIIKPAGDTGRSVIEVRAAAKGLDVAVAGAVTRAIAGDLNGIRTAFSVAKEGHLTDATYFAGFETGSNGLQLTTMKASGHLTRGLVTIPGIEADLERMDADVIYEDQHVEFKNVRGHFKGATFQGLDAAIDWEDESTLSISSNSVSVDAAPLHTWLTSFKGLSGVKNYIESIAGTARLTKLHINGPLTEPANWVYEISGTPEDIRITSPLVPFEVRLSGGEIIYIPGKERAADVRIEFLDGSFVSSYQSKGIVNPETISCHFDGSMGQAAIEWLNTVLPIPRHLQMKPPVDLSGVNIAWSDTQTFSFMGGMKTAGGVELFADFTVSPQDWHIRRIQFADGSSQATASARKHPDGIEIGFSGNVEKTTADRILANNQTLSGRLEGDFRAVIDTRAPLNSSFTGKLAGEGLHILRLVSDPIEVRQFSIDGSGNQLKIAPSEVSLCNSLLVVDGVLDNGDGNLTFDINVDADRLDEELIRALEPIGKDKANAQDKPEALSVMTPRGKIHVKADDFTYGGFTWSQVQADIRIEDSETDVQVSQANLCGISTTGELGFSPRGVSLHVTPTATGASLQETAGCLWDKPLKADARYDLAGEINLPTTRQDPAQFMSGQIEFSSDNGRIQYANVLMKVISVLNVTEVFTGGKSDFTEEGYGYTKAYAKAVIGGGKLQFDEILLDGNSLKITGQGSIDLKDREVDIILLAAPLKTVDHIVNKLPIINYITGGSLISVPLRIEGEISDLSVVPIPPSAVGKGLLGIMGRTLKAPFKLVESAAALAPEGSTSTVDTTQKGP